MNQRPQGLKVQKALTGFLQYKSAEGLAPVTVSGYERDLKLWIEYQGDVNIGNVQSGSILAFLNYLRVEYVPRLCWLLDSSARYFGNFRQEFRPMILLFRPRWV